MHEPTARRAGRTTGAIHPQPPPPLVLDLEVIARSPFVAPSLRRFVASSLPPLPPNPLRPEAGHDRVLAAPPPQPGRRSVRGDRHCLDRLGPGQQQGRPVRAGDPGRGDLAPRGLPRSCCITGPWLRPAARPAGGVGLHRRCGRGIACFALLASEPARSVSGRRPGYATASHRPVEEGPFRDVCLGRLDPRDAVRSQTAAQRVKQLAENFFERSVGPSGPTLAPLRSAADSIRRCAWTL